jgi:hypothetical protein
MIVAGSKVQQHTMSLHVRKNIQFTKLVKAPKQLKEFNFRKLPGAEESFHVDVNDDRGNRIFFNMRKDNNQWKIAESLVPQWITDVEEKLDAAISEELSK